MTQSKEPMSWFTKQELSISFLRIEEVRTSGILTSDGVKSPLFKSAITELLIYINDMLQKADAMGLRITLADHLPAWTSVPDVTELVARCRDAACHVSAGQEFFERNKFSFALVVGLVPEAVKIDGTLRGSDFEDDIALFFGGYRLYLRRNLLDAYTLAVRALQSLVNPEPTEASTLS
ncbi:hypothetical protein ED208_11965 [Stagnimonas aquatica]|uniref:Uncharacterized protein n=1 Tax=Stagnimonas aquatica TaxID=2689987 RepID=A0A3N0V8R6_9GAMM|nr:hypothetical protein [Stagnimonas aquatica]ROH89119.1 hypothetical protein ED208_11965 [Stagnimonas aquatica]